MPDLIPHIKAWNLYRLANIKKVNDSLASSAEFVLKFGRCITIQLNIICLCLLVFLSPFRSLCGTSYQTYLALMAGFDAMPPYISSQGDSVEPSGNVYFMVVFSVELQQRMNSAGTGLALKVDA